VVSIVIAGVTGKDADNRELVMKLTSIDGTEVFKRIHGSFLGVVKLLSLGASTENPY
jgi:hypothetical protein